MNNGITSDNIMGTLPGVLAADPDKEKLAQITADILAQRVDEIDSIILFKNIDTMPEGLLDIIAYDFKVDWWSSDYTVAEKRQILKDSWHIHRMLGTKAAVVKAVQALYPNAEVEEWFEYSGSPYHFRIWGNDGDGMADYEKLLQVIYRINYYKSLRSYCDWIRFEAELTVQQYMGAGLHTVDKYKIHTPEIEEV